MKVIHLINSFGYGGAERQLASLAAAAVEQDIQQSLTTLCAVSESMPLSSRVRWVNASAGLFSPLTAPWILWRELRREQVSVVVAWMYHSWLVALIVVGLSARRPRLFLYGRHADVVTLKPTTRMVAWCALLLARWMKVPVVFNSHDAEAKHARWTNAGQTCVIPNGISPTQAANVATREQRNRIGFLGRNHPDKGADLLPELVPAILSQLPEWRCVLAGPGMERLRSRLAERMASAGLDPSRVEVLGTQHCSRTFMADIDLLLLPSRTESFPNVLVEALTSGVLVAATSVGDIRQVLDGLLPSVEHPAQVADLAVKLCRIPEQERHDLAGVLLESVSQRYNWDAVLQQHVRLWRGHGSV